jgi:hypothetical protein
VRFGMYVTLPTPSGVRGDVCPETAQRHLGQPGAPATVAFTGIGGSQAFAVTDPREVPT